MCFTFRFVDLLTIFLKKECSFPLSPLRSLQLFNGVDVFEEDEARSGLACELVKQNCIVLLAPALSFLIFIAILFFPEAKNGRTDVFFRSLPYFIQIVVFSSFDVTPRSFVRL